MLPTFISYGLTYISLHFIESGAHPITNHHTLMPAPLRSVSNPDPSTRQQPRAKPHPVPACLNNELSIDTTSPTTSMGPQPRPKPCLIPAPLNEGLSIDTTSPMTSISHKVEK